MVEAFVNHLTTNLIEQPRWSLRCRATGTGPCLWTQRLLGMAGRGG
jgi:hypothetical protein